MKKFLFALLLIFLSVNLALAVPGYIDTFDYKLTHKDINDFLYYIKIHPYPTDEKGNLIINYSEYDNTGIQEYTSFTTYELLMQEINMYAAIFKYQGYGHKTIDYVSEDNEEVACKYYINDNLLKQNKLKNSPQGAIKLPTVTLGNLRIAKYDTKYTPVQESPYKLNYWAGARNACTRNGMRLPTKDEFENIYNNKSALKFNFSDGEYWVADEISPCFANSETVEGMTVGTSYKVQMDSNLPYETKKYLKDKNVTLRVNIDSHYDVYPLITKKNSSNVKVRCVR